MSYETYTVIDHVTVSTAVTSITFDSIPQTYKHLELRALLHSEETGTASTVRIANMYFNDDTTLANYRSQYTMINGVPNYDVRGSGSTELYIPTDRGASYTDIYSIGSFRLRIPNYTGTGRNKFAFVEWYTTIEVESFYNMGHYRINSQVTNPLTKIEFVCGGGYNWRDGSNIQLLGIS